MGVDPMVVRGPDPDKNLVVRSYMAWTPRKFTEINVILECGPNQAYRCQTDTWLGQLPDLHWKCPPVHGRSRWFDHI